MGKYKKVIVQDETLGEEPQELSHAAAVTFVRGSIEYHISFAGDGLSIRKKTRNSMGITIALDGGDAIFLT